MRSDCARPGPKFLLRRAASKPTLEARRKRSHMRTLGIDVSHYQKNVNWESVARSDVKFAFAKATESNSAVDHFFAANWRGIQDAGLFRGAYHFGRPGTD